MSVRNGQFQLVGDQKALGQKPIDSPSANPRSGQFQIPGDQKKINHNKTVQSPSANPGNGAFQIPGDQVKLNRAPIHGWASAARLAMSDRAIKQGQTAAGGGRGKGKR